MGNYPWHEATVTIAPSSWVCAFCSARIVPQHESADSPQPLSRDHFFWAAGLFQRQLSGISNPLLVPPMFLHEEVAALFMKVSLMSCNLIPLHGLLGLQSNVTASGVADVPFIFLYVT
ncbi:hypothetical protein LWI29_030725 [Acer saccharum]|uniref:Uncharacterized protein n=1 Tax=Acer saccharum TaxID=4024 RepID=A0AA39TXU6_ACESA|nr:hypothetical protein LWI29_030725 [Acer saccharum]